MALNESSWASMDAKCNFKSHRSFQFKLALDCSLSFELDQSHFFWSKVNHIETVDLVTNPMATLALILSLIYFALKSQVSILSIVDDWN